MLAHRRMVRGGDPFCRLSHTTLGPIPSARIPPYEASSRTVRDHDGSRPLSCVGRSNCRKVSLPPGCRKFVFHHVSRPDHHVVTVGPVGRLGPRLYRWMSHPARSHALFRPADPSRPVFTITPFPAVACFPAPVGLRLAVLGTCEGLPRNGALQLLSGWCAVGFAFPVRREKYVSIQNQISQAKCCQTETISLKKHRRHHEDIGGHARQGTKKPLG